MDIDDELKGSIENIEKAMYNRAIPDTYGAVYYCKDCMKYVKIKDGLCKHMGNYKLGEDFTKEV